VDGAEIEGLVRPFRGQLLGQTAFALGHGEQPAREAAAQPARDGQGGAPDDRLAEDVGGADGDAAQLYWRAPAGCEELTPPADDLVVAQLGERRMSPVGEGPDVLAGPAGAQVGGGRAAGSGADERG